MFVEDFLDWTNLSQNLLCTDGHIFTQTSLLFEQLPVEIMVWAIQLRMLARYNEKVL